MRITNLPESSSFSSSDVLAIEVNGRTYKLTGSTLAAAVESIGNFVTGSDVVTTTTDGLMLSTDKVKLNGIAAGAQVNTITGVKGNAESTYRTGNVNLTPANVGAVNKAGDTMTGSLTTTSIELMPASGGSFIDFHYNGSTTDYTVRIGETSAGKLGINAAGDTSYFPIAMGVKLETTYTGAVYGGGNVKYVVIPGKAPQHHSVWFCRNITNGGIYTARCTSLTDIGSIFAFDAVLAGSAAAAGDNLIIMYFVI